MASPSTITTPSLGASSPARILSTVVLPQPEWPITHANSPRGTDSQRFSKTATSSPPGCGYRLAIASIEMNLSVMASFRKRHHAGEAREDLIEQHAHEPDQENGDDHISDRKVVPLIPDEVADAGATHEHFGRHDHEPGDADRYPHAGENCRRSRGQDHGKGAPQRADFERAGHVDPFLADGGDAKGGIEQHRPYRADEDHEDRRQTGIFDGVERERHPGQRRDRFENLDERIERAADQRRHPDQESQRNRDEDGEQITKADARNRIAELDAEPLVVR